MDHQDTPTTSAAQLPALTTNAELPESGTDSPQSRHAWCSVSGAMGLLRPGAEHDPELKPPPGCSALETEYRDRGGDNFLIIHRNPPNNFGIETVTHVAEENVTNDWPNSPVTTTYTFNGDRSVSQIEVTPITDANIDHGLLSVLSKAHPKTIEVWIPAEVRFVKRDGIEQSPAQSACGTKYQSSRGTKRGPEPEPEPWSPHKRGCY